MNAFEKMTSSLQNDIASADETIASFNEQVAKNPAYAAQWAASFFAASATKTECSEALAEIEYCVDKNLPFAEYAAEQVKRLISAARMADNFSTSATSNLLAASTIAARAKIAESATRYNH